MDQTEAFRQACRNDLLTFCKAMYQNFESPRHIQLLAHELQNVESRTTKRLMITMPPRHGKTMTASQMFPAWYLGRHPQHFIIVSSYAQTLSDDSGEAVRDIMLDPLYQWIFPEATLRKGSKSRSKFTTAQGGKGFFVGVGGSVTGRGAHCLIGSTLIQAEHGERTIKSIVECPENLPKVWSYNHQLEKPELQQVLAVKTSWAENGIYQIDTDSGKRIRCTPEHNFYDLRNKQYVAAKDLEMCQLLRWDKRLVDPASAGDIALYSRKMAPDVPQIVYDIQVANNNNFFANNILTHNCLLIDDPYKDDEEADSEAIRKAVRNFFQGTAYTRLMPDGAIIVISTRWRHDDLIGWLLDPKEHDRIADWKKFDLPAIATEERSPWDWRQPGEALWPERFSTTTLDETRLEGVGNRKFQAMYQQRPTVAEGNIFKKAYLREVALAEIENNLISPKIMFMDTAFKEEQHNDYSAAVAACRTRDGYVAILEAMHRRLDFPKLLQWTKDIIQAHEIEALYIEDKASGQSLIQTLKSELSIPIVPIKAETDKVARANAIVPFMESGKVLFKKPLFEDLEQELLTFPFAGHDDLVDACVGAITVLTRANFSLSMKQRNSSLGIPGSIYGR